MELLCASSNMSKRHLLLFIPVLVIVLLGLAIYSMLVVSWPWFISVYIVVSAIAVIYTARQSVFVQTSLVWWDPDSLSSKEADELAASVFRDFSIFVSIHLAVISIIYWLCFWVLSSLI